MGNESHQVCLPFDLQQQQGQNHLWQKGAALNKMGRHSVCCYRDSCGLTRAQQRCAMLYTWIAIAIYLVSFWENKLIVVHNQWLQDSSLLHESSVLLVVDTIRVDKLQNAGYINLVVNSSISLHWNDNGCWQTIRDLQHRENLWFQEIWVVSISTLDKLNSLHTLWL